MANTLQLLVLVVPLLGMAACLEDPAPPRVNSQPTCVPSAPSQRPPPPPIEVTSSSFSESATVRDPFRETHGFMCDLGWEMREAIKRRELATALRDVPIGELRLVGVVTSAHERVAMLVGPSGQGASVRREQQVGETEIVHSNIEGRTDYAVKWRVSRVEPSRTRRDAEGRFVESAARVVFEREDPLNPNGGPVYSTVTAAERPALRGTLRLASAATR